MYVEDEFVRRAVGRPGIVHPQQRIARTRIESTERGFVGAWKQDELGRGARVADGVDHGLEGVGPGRNIEIIRLVHEAKGDICFPSVRLRELGPEGDEIVVGRASLAYNAVYNAVVPTSIVVNIYDAERTGVKAASHNLIVIGEEARIELTAELTGDEVLPAYGKAKNIEAVVIDKVSHLRRS